MQQPVKNIIFDLGGVLLNLDMKRTEDAFVNMGITNFNELFRIGHASSIFKEHEVGAISDAEFISRLQRMTGNRFDEKAVCGAWNALLCDFPPERIAFLQELKKKYRLFLFSNTNAIHHEYFSRQFRDTFHFSLDDLFEKAWYSHVIGYRKPDVKAYEYVVKNSGIEAVETLFIDDALKNVEGAVAAGLQGYHLSPGRHIQDIEGL